jgi:hypothetical protein
LHWQALLPEATSPVPFPTLLQPTHTNFAAKKYDLGSEHSQAFVVRLKTKVLEHVHAGVPEVVSTNPVLFNPLKVVQTKHFSSIRIEFPGHWHET